MKLDRVDPGLNPMIKTSGGKAAISMTTVVPSRKSQRLLSQPAVRPLLLGAASLLIVFVGMGLLLSLFAAAAGVGCPAFRRTAADATVTRTLPCDRMGDHLRMHGKRRKRT